MRTVKIISAGAVLIALAVIAYLLLKPEQNPVPPAEVTGSCAEAAKTYIGLNEVAANLKAGKESRPVRTVSRDGKGFAITQDFQTRRINFEVAGGKVVKADCY